MHLVALLELRGPVDDAAAALGAALGGTAYEERMNLAAGLPAVLLATPDAARAEALCAAVRARGQRALTCDLSSVTPSSAMVPLRRFRFDADALVALELPGEQRLPFAELRALVRATCRTSSESRETVEEKKFSLGRAVLTTGLVRSKTVEREVVRRTAEQQEALYLFPRRGRPWLLRELEAHYTALGGAVSPTALHNFHATVEKLRALAPAAAYDDRMTGAWRVPARAARAAASPDAALDLLAHLVAASLSPT